MVNWEEILRINSKIVRLWSKRTWKCIVINVYITEEKCEFIYIKKKIRNKQFKNLEGQNNQWTLTTQKKIHIVINIKKLSFISKIKWNHWYKNQSSIEEKWKLKFKKFNKDRIRSHIIVEIEGSGIKLIELDIESRIWIKIETRNTFQIIIG